VARFSPGHPNSSIRGQSSSLGRPFRALVPRHAAARGVDAVKAAAPERDRREAVDRSLPARGSPLLIEAVQERRRIGLRRATCLHLPSISRAEKRRAKSQLFGHGQSDISRAGATRRRIRLKSGLASRLVGERRRDGIRARCRSYEGCSPGVGRRKVGRAVVRVGIFVARLARGDVAGLIRGGGRLRFGDTLRRSVAGQGDRGDAMVTP
jgi:hypothetical protein